ncbi:MAG: hypothetical protein MJ252_17710 [archaeon]|nr:hypothetical protein [archaeon]
MVALSIVICSKTAKIIFARQFVQMTRRELEEYVVQFSRNIDSCKEITHFESDKVRYIFIPVDSFYLILISSKNSNIIEDTEIIKSVYRLLQDICGSVDYDSIISNAFEISLGIDDLVCLGYRNGVNITQVKQYLQMESLEEKEFRRKKLEQERKVQRELSEKAREFDKLKREKKFLTDAISSSDFAEEEPKTKELQRVYQTERRNDNVLNDKRDKEKEIEEQHESELKVPEKKTKGGLKLVKRKNFQ